MKKVISIIVALALMLSLSIAATPVLADVTAAEVIVDKPWVNTKASYDITFNISTTLAIGDTLAIEFPLNTVVPATGTYKVNDVRVSDGSIWRAISPGDITRSGQVVTIKLPIGIGAPGPVSVVFELSAGITNPPTVKNDYKLRVRTSQEPTWKDSQPYALALQDNSTYEFVYAVPALISVNVSTPVGVTLKTKVLGEAGYPEAQILFSKLVGTGDVTFDVLYGGTWYSSTNSGSYPPDSGNFTLVNDDQEDISFNLTFEKVGVYTLNFTLLNVAEVPSETLVDDKPTLTCAGVSINVPLKKGWNLISLPIIPDNSAIAVVLADVLDDVESVWYYDPTFTNPADRWRTYKPGAPSLLTKMEDGKAYWVDMKEEATLTVAGVAIVPPQQLPPSYSVREGWNMVGFKSMDPMKAEDYLDGTEFVRVYKFENGAWTSIGKDGLMESGLGYWVAFSKAGTIYP